MHIQHIVYFKIMHIQLYIYTTMYVRKCNYKGSVSRDVLLRFFRESFPPSPKIFSKFTEIFASQGAPPATGINDTGGKFATGVVYTGGINDIGGAL
jgi:hypothetical protein